MDIKNVKGIKSYYSDKRKTVIQTSIPIPVDQKLRHAVNVGPGGSGGPIVALGIDLICSVLDESSTDNYAVAMDRVDLGTLLHDITAHNPAQNKSVEEALREILSGFELARELLKDIRPLDR